MPATLAAWRTDPSEFSRTIKTQVLLRDLDLEQAIRKGYVSVRHEDGHRSVWIFPKAGSDYDWLKFHHRVKISGQALATPHGWFWGLPHENFKFAAKFLKLFGPFSPVTLRLNGGDEYAPVDLGDFWNKQLRFKAVTKLWITLEDIGALRQSWAELGSQLTQIDVADDFPLGSIPKPDASGHVELDLTILQHLRNQALNGASVKIWLEEQGAATLKQGAISLVEAELDAHLWHLAHWQSGAGTVRPSFELTLVPVNLWSALWYLFALDTQRRVGWRICPNDQRLFYPPRKDRFYCTTEEQQIHSKSDWWERHKETELEKRRAVRRDPRETLIKFSIFHRCSG
jgi:hypothetical protein